MVTLYFCDTIFLCCAIMTNQRQYESQYDDVEKCTMLTSWETHSIVVDSARVRKLRCNLLRVTRRSNVLYSIARFVIWMLYGITMKEMTLGNSSKRTWRIILIITILFRLLLLVMAPLKWQTVCDFA